MIPHSSKLSPIVIRKFCIEDYNTLIALWDKAKLIYKPQGSDRRDNIERELKGHNAIFFVAEKDGTLIGSIFGTHDGRKGWINRLAVDPAYQRQGIAARLVREVEDHLYERGIGIIACLVEDWNSVSLQVFEKLGYTRHQDIIYFTKRKYPDI